MNIKINQENIRLQRNLSYLERRSKELGLDFTNLEASINDDYVRLQYDISNKDGKNMVLNIHPVNHNKFDDIHNQGEVSSGVNAIINFYKGELERPFESNLSICGDLVLAVFRGTKINRGEALYGNMPNFAIAADDPIHFFDKENANEITYGARNDKLLNIIQNRLGRRMIPRVKRGKISDYKFNSEKISQRDLFDLGLDILSKWEEFKL